MEREAAVCDALLEISRLLWTSGHAREADDLDQIVRTFYTAWSEAYGEMMVSLLKARAVARADNKELLTLLDNTINAIALLFECIGCSA